MLINLINDLLDLAKEENLTFQLNKEYFDLVEIINESFETLKFISENRNIKTIVEIDPEHQHYFNCIYGDRGRYQQFLLNFISNSLKFTENGGQVTVQIKLNKLRKSKSDKRNSTGQSLNDKIN